MNETDSYRRPGLEGKLPTAISEITNIFVKGENYGFYNETNRSSRRVVVFHSFPK